MPVTTRIVLVEDDSIVRTVPLEILSISGYSVTSAAEALQLNDWESDLVISGYLLLGMLGDEFLKWYRVDTQATSQRIRKK